MTYAQRIEAVEQIVRGIESTDDIDEALRMHEEATAHLNHCRATIEAAKGKLKIVKDTDESS